MVVYGFWLFDVVPISLLKAKVGLESTPRRTSNSSWTWMRYYIFGGGVSIASSSLIATIWLGDQTLDARYNAKSSVCLLQPHVGIL